MNLAPWAAYGQQGRQADRKVAGIQRYYTSAEDMQAGREAGKLNKDTLVTLSDAIVTRSRDRRQFTEVTITRETKNAAGETLAAGTKVWTVSDRGSLRAIKSAAGSVLVGKMYSCLHHSAGRCGELYLAYRLGLLSESGRCVAQ